MASEKTLNAKNLAALGVEQLAELLLELTTGDAAAKRRLRLELASRSGGGDVAAQISKRLASIARSRSFVDWRKIRPLAQDLDMQRTAIMTHVAPTKPAEAFDLLWRREFRLVTMARDVVERSPRRKHWNLRSTRSRMAYSAFRHTSRKSRHQRVLPSISS